MLAGSYDALKAVDPTINVIGVGLSPRGNDQPFGKSNRSRSPVRFLHELGVAYRASHRTKPLMDELAYHPYPQASQGPPSVRYAWPTAGLANLDRIKLAVWDAFNGTAQPTFAETGKPATKPLRFDLDEVGWQVRAAAGAGGDVHRRRDGRHEARSAKRTRPATTATRSRSPSAIRACECSASST